MRPIDDMSLDELRLEIANKKGYPPEFNFAVIPDYPRSWQAAGELLGSFDNWSVERCYQQFCCNIQDGEFILASPPDSFFGEGESAPEAISRAWLKWKESQDAK